jgi:hypothetical protein
MTLAANRGGVWVQFRTGKLIGASLILVVTMLSACDAVYGVQQQVSLRISENATSEPLGGATVQIHSIVSSGRVFEGLQAAAVTNALGVANAALKRRLLRGGLNSSPFVPEEHDLTGADCVVSVNEPGGFEEVALTLRSGFEKCGRRFTVRVSRVGSPLAVPVD